MWVTYNIAKENQRPANLPTQGCEAHRLLLFKRSWWQAGPLLISNTTCKQPPLGSLAGMMKLQDNLSSLIGPEAKWRIFSS